MWNLHTLNTSVYFKLFDAQVLPSLLYGSELWGLSKRHTIEKAHLFACKRILNVDSRSPNTLCYGELGRFPVYICAVIRAVKYWLRLCKMSTDRLPKQAYLMMLSGNTLGQRNWVQLIRTTLSRFGFGYVWINGVVNERSFLRSFRRRLCDCFLQEWSAKVSGNTRFAFYSSFKKDLQCERYLCTIEIKKFRDVLYVLD